jgi:hypothetical protein
VWHMDKEQWHLLWTGEQAFWQVVPRLLAAGHGTMEGQTEPRKSSTGQPYKIPRLMAAQDGECTQTLRIVLSRGIAGIDERTRGLAQRWFDMVDWRSANVGSAQSGDSRSIESHTKKLEGEVHRQHPARVWVERQERKSPAKEPERTTTTHECASQLSQLVVATGGGRAATEIDWRAADPSRHPNAAGA